MTTDQRTGTRSVTAAPETLAAVALVGLSIGTLLRCLADRPGGIAGVILTLMALAFISRYRVSWNRQGITRHTPFRTTFIAWRDISAFSVEPNLSSEPGRLFPDHPKPRHRRAMRLLLHGAGTSFSISLALFSFQDIRHLTAAIGSEVPLHESEAALVS